MGIWQNRDLVNEHWFFFFFFLLWEENIEYLWIVCQKKRKQPIQQHENFLCCISDVRI